MGKYAINSPIFPPNQTEAASGNSYCTARSALSLHSIRQWTARLIQEITFNFVHATALRTKNRISDTGVSVGTIGSFTACTYHSAAVRGSVTQNDRFMRVMEEYHAILAKLGIIGQLFLG